MFRSGTLLLIVVLFLTGCYQSTNDGIPEFPSQSQSSRDSSAGIRVEITEQEIRAAIQEALNAAPLLTNPQIDLQPGKITVRGDGVSLSLIVTVQNGTFFVQTSNLIGLQSNDPRLTDFSQKVKEQLTARAVRTMIWTN